MEASSILFNLRGAQFGNSISSTLSKAKTIEFENDVLNDNLLYEEERLKLQGAQALKVGIDRRVKIQEELKQAIGRRNAKTGNSGTAIGTGSNAHKILSMVHVATVEELAVMDEAYNQKYAYEFQANEVRGQREMASVIAKNAKRNTIIAGGMQALGIAAQGMSEFSKLGGGFGSTQKKPTKAELNKLHTTTSKGISNLPRF